MLWFFQINGIMNFLELLRAKSLETSYETKNYSTTSSTHPNPLLQYYSQFNTPSRGKHIFHNLTNKKKKMFLSKLIFARFIALNISKLALCMSQVTLLLPFLQVMQFLKQKTQQGILLVVQIEMFPKDQ